METDKTKLKINELMEHFNIKSVSEFAKLTLKFCKKMWMRDITY
jgi:hypothetical protein